jgi:hypothetical protein
MFSAIAGFPILGLPLVLYLGIIALLCLLFTATISTLNKRRIRFLSMKWHIRMAYTTIVFALAHGSLILLSLLGL